MVLKSTDKRRIIRRILNEARRRARAAAPSKTIKRAMQLKIDSDIQGRIHIPQYWAVWYHDGRGPIRAKGRKLVFFANPKDDPRLAGGHPVTRGSVKHLTEKQYTAGLKRNKELKGTGLVHMFVVDFVQGAQGFHFFDRAMVGIVPIIDQIIKEEVDRVVKEIIIGTSEQKTIIIRI